MSSGGDRPIRVLHVEDDPDFADLAATCLERESDRIAVETAGDAEAGLAAIESGEVDCVVSDFDMPGLDGLEFLEIVRERHPDLPFILYTGKGSEEIASEAIAAGVTDYLQKGGGTEQYTVLANRVSHAVKRHRAERELERRRRRFELIGRASADAFWELDPRTGRVERSDGYAEMFGYDPDAVPDHQEWWMERVHPEDRDEVLAARDAAFEEGGGVFEADYRFEKADGTYAHVYARGYADFDGEKPVRAVGAVTDVSDLRARERELESVRTRLKLVLDGTDTGVWEWDPATDEVVWDETVERLFGLAPGEFEGTYGAFRRRVVEEDVERVEREIAATLEHDDRYTVEFRVRRDDGERRWVQAEGLLHEEETEGRLIGLIRDVTDRKLREEQLRRIERRFDAVFNDPEVFAAILDTDGTLLLGSQAGTEFLGVPHGERSGKHFLQTAWWKDAPEAKRAEVAELLDRAADGEFVRFQASHTNDDGETLHLDAHIRPVTGDDGEVVSLLLEGIDVSERVERERMIERLHEATRALVRCRDRESVAEMVVESVAEILGFPSNVVRLRRGDELHPAAVSAGAREVLGERPVYAVGREFPGQAIESGEPLLIDDLSEVDDGVDRGAHQSALYVPIGDHGVLSVGDDAVGAFDRADVALATILVNNAASVLDRVEGERAIRRRERELARQNEHLEEFASVVSHDLRNPLNVAKGRLELLDVDEEERATIDNALDRMASLLDDVYRLASEGLVVGNREPVELESVARSAWQTVVTNGASLEVGDLGVVEADETRLIELFENLFRNAVEHGDPHGTIRVGATDRGFFVEDDGPGVPEEERDRLFEPGYTTREEGTGFGLAIVESIATAHGWEVAVGDGESGARFEIVTEPRGERTGSE